jgi:hypothetical protein
MDSELCADEEHTGITPLSFFKGTRPIGLSQTRTLLLLLVSSAFVVRFVTRMAFGEEYFWVNGYDDYFEMGQNFSKGMGLCIERMGWKHAYWPPIYPLFLALVTIGTKSYIPIILVQAMAGAGTTLCAFLIGREFFGQVPAIIAGLITAFYPYYVMPSMTATLSKPSRKSS